MKGLHKLFRKRESKEEAEPPPGAPVSPIVEEPEGRLAQVKKLFNRGSLVSEKPAETTPTIPPTSENTGINPSTAGRNSHNLVQNPDRSWWSSTYSSPWALAFVVVKFDLEAGQVVEKVIPEGALTKEQEKELCYLGFPDSNSHIVNDTCYVIKVRRPQSKVKFDYGYVYFRQKSDGTVARGCVQHSLILLSRWPFASLLEQVVKNVAQTYFSLCPISPTPITTKNTSTSTSIQPVLTYNALKLQAPAVQSPITGSPVPSAASICFLSDFGADDQESAQAACFGSLIIVVSVMGMYPQHFEPRYQLLQDTLSEMATWSHPEACSEYVFPFLSSQIHWHAPKFTVTSKVTALNCSRRDILSPKHRRRVAHDMRTREKSLAPSEGSGKARLLDRLNGTKYLFGEVPLYSTFANSLKKLWRLWELSLLGEPLCIMSQSPTVSSSAVLAVTSLIHPVTSCVDFRPYFSVQDVDFKTISKHGTDDVPFTKKGPIIGVTNPYFVKVLKVWPHILTLRPEKDENESKPDIKRSRKRHARERLLSDFHETFISERHFVVDDSSERINPVLSKLIHTGDPVTMDQVNTEILRAHFVELTCDFLQPLQACFDKIWSSLNCSLLQRPAALRKGVSTEDFRSYVYEKGYKKKLFKRGRRSVLRLYDSFVYGCHFANWLEETVCETYKNELQECIPSELLPNATDNEIVDVVTALCQDLTFEERKVVTDSVMIASLQKVIDSLLGRLPDSTRKEVLRNHYKSSLGDDVQLPVWLVEQEHEQATLQPPVTTEESDDPEEESRDEDTGDSFSESPAESSSPG
eukprot:TRINITY_DN2122_c1_g1_i1.p1 TRINITY_DN2122_c1_g1~~TRINITY_DN2122_c1_g1_i1.p1  ORF type:complete len:807 (+),score=124.43 TRINITY_DN2122_c1_g1_i1:34-2454(+)